MPICGPHPRPAASKTWLFIGNFRGGEARKLNCRFMERAMGIETASEAGEGSVLQLKYVLLFVSDCNLKLVFRRGI